MIYLYTVVLCIVHGVIYKDTVALLNTTDLSPVMESTELMRVIQSVKTSAGVEGGDKKSEEIQVCGRGG